MKIYDLAIIGSGPGGYVAALYASRHKLSVCVVENNLLGGTCLNRGCIPTKTLINSASLFSSLKNIRSTGIEVDNPRLNFQTVMSRKDSIVSRLRTGIETLFRASGIELIRGSARIESADTISIDDKDRIKSKHIIIAVGSRVSSVPGIDIDEMGILSSDGMLGIDSLPESLTIIGGGVVGCEFASLFNSLGCRVTLIELADRLISNQSKEVSKKLEISFKKSMIDVMLSERVERVEKGKAQKTILSGGRVIESEKVLVAIGRAPNTENLGDIEKIGIKKDSGYIKVSSDLTTGIKNIYAIGDCVRGPLLAHRASYDGILACDNILGHKRLSDYSSIPYSIWTDPEIASVGINEEEARAKYPDIKIAKFPYIASGKAYLMGRSEGFFKIIGTSKGDILGIEILGLNACELIAEAVLAKSANINIKDWARVVHAHPTLSEIAQEAAQIFCGTGIHTV